MIFKSTSILNTVSCLSRKADRQVFDDFDVILPGATYTHTLAHTSVMFSISILCYFDSHHSCFIYINCSVVAMVLDQERD